MKGIGGDRFKSRWLLLCEGPADMNLFARLLRARNLPQYDVRFPGAEIDPTGGRGKFGRYLSTAIEAPTFKENTRAKIKLRQITVQMLFCAMLIDTAHSA
jgi:hypothetical protein